MSREGRNNAQKYEKSYDTQRISNVSNHVGFRTSTQPTDRYLTFQIKHSKTLLLSNINNAKLNSQKVGGCHFYNSFTSTEQALTA